MKRAIWICFDLGVRANYSGFYAWLDERDAKECSGNVAFLRYEPTGSLVKDIREEMHKIFDPDPTARIYLIYRNTDTKKVRGVFIMGQRKGNPWDGFAPRPSPPDEEGNLDEES